nr:hypothetical protein [uncultured Azospirillum sp.]
MIASKHTAVYGGDKDACVSDFYIDHLRPDQLRQRAADERADALMLAGKLSAETVNMLLTSADRCEMRAAVLEYMAGGSLVLFPHQAPRSSVA